MPKFRKKPVVIEAVKFDGSEMSIVNIMSLMTRNSGNVSKQIDVDNGGKSLFIHTLEGKMEANLGDWIIKGVQGELYPCKPDIFESTYEEV